MRIVIIISDSKSLFGLRKELVESWVNAGHEVIAIGDGPETEFADKCQNHGFKYISVTLSRNGINPITDFKTLRQLSALLKELKPDRVFCTFAKAIAYGAWASRKAGISETYVLISGLGSGFRGHSVKEKILSKIMELLYKNAFKGCEKVIFQNNDDVDELVRRKLLDRSKVEIVNGSGVDINRFSQSKLPQKHTFLFVARLLKEKGIQEYIASAEIVKTKYPDSRFMVVGDIDSNPSSLTQSEVDTYRAKGLIEFYGFQTDVRPYINQADIFVLPSYHEGTPRCVLEAMSMGRPIVTTDAPGCRETVRPGINGYLVPVKNSTELAQKMIYLLDHYDIAQHMGNMSRKIAEEKYDVEIVLAEYQRIMKLY